MKKFVINEEFLQSLESLQLCIRNNVAGQFGGNSKSKSFGSSPEFADYRDYADGDDVTKIDWNAYARFDKLYLKLYLDERQMHTRIYIDASRSMEFGEGKKAEQSIRLAAAFAYMSVANMDKVSIYAVSGDEITEVIGGIVGKDAYISSIGKLNDIVFDGECKISDAVIPSKLGYGDGLSILISDFLTDHDYERCIDHLAAKRRDLLCLQVLDAEELHPHFSGRYHLFDSEDLEREYKKNIDADIKAAYRDALDYIKTRVESFVTSRGGRYLLVSTEDSMNDVFLKGLTTVEVVK